MSNLLGIGSMTCVRLVNEIALVPAIPSATSGKTGSPIENQAHDVAGVIMREYGKIQPLIYESKVTKNGKGIKSNKRVL